MILATGLLYVAFIMLSYDLIQVLGPLTWVLDEVTHLLIWILFELIAHFQTKFFSSLAINNFGFFGFIYW